MSSSAQPSSEDQKARMFHDILGHLHSIGLGLEVLRGTREDADEFQSMYALVSKESQAATDLVLTLRNLVRDDSQRDR